MAQDKYADENGNYYWWLWPQREIARSDGEKGGTGPATWNSVPEGQHFGLAPAVTGTSARKAGDHMIVSGEGCDKACQGNGEAVPTPPGIDCQKVRMTNFDEG